MNIKDLTYFNHLAQTLSFTETASHFYISQPSISMAIKRLEDELDTLLIDRKNNHKKLSLTETGHILLKYSQQIITSIEQAHEEIHDFNHQIVYFGLLPTIGGHFMPELLPNLGKYADSLKLINWIFLVIIGIGLGILTFFIFKWAILKYDIKTPGREEAQNLNNTLIKEKRYGEIAEIVVAALGGKENIDSVENCITRLRIDVKDINAIDKGMLEKSGCTGFFFPAPKHIHIVYGPQVEFVRNAVDDAL